MADTTDTSGGITAAIQAIVKGIQRVVDKLDGFIDWLFELAPNVIKALVLMLKDWFLWCLEQLLTLAKGIIDGMTGFDDIIAQAATIWAGVPPEVMTVIQAIGLGTALTIITGAIMIRLVLQLIPFVRLGS